MFASHHSLLQSESRWGLCCVSMVAGGVAQHLVGRFQGEYETYGDILKVCGTIPRGWLINTHTHTHIVGLSAALHHSPSHHPALRCLHLMCCQRVENLNGAKAAHVKLYRSAALSSPVRQRMQREAPKAFIMLIWNVRRLRWSLFVFCHGGRCTHAVCAVTTAWRDRQIQPPHNILLMGGTWSSFSHDSALTRKQQTTTTAQLQPEGGAWLLHYLLNYTNAWAVRALLWIEQETADRQLVVWVVLPQDKVVFPQNVLGSAY